jgi:hypothetical protein
LLLIETGDLAGARHFRIADEEASRASLVMAELPDLHVAEKVRVSETAQALFGPEAATRLKEDLGGRRVEKLTDGLVLPIGKRREDLDVRQDRERHRDDEPVRGESLRASSFVVEDSNASAVGSLDPDDG